MTTFRNLSFITLILLNCSNPAKDSSATSTDSLTTEPTTQADISGISHDDFFKLESYLVQSINDTSIVKIIDYDCAIFVDPSEAQAEEMKKKYGEDVFYTVADDNSFYDSQAIDSLNLANIRIISLNKDFLKLKGLLDVCVPNLISSERSPLPRERGQG